MATHLCTGVLRFFSALFPFSALQEGYAIEVYGGMLFVPEAQVCVSGDWVAGTPALAGPPAKDPLPCLGTLETVSCRTRKKTAERLARLACIKENVGKSHEWNPFGRWVEDGGGASTACLQLPAVGQIKFALDASIVYRGTCVPLKLLLPILCFSLL